MWSLCSRQCLLVASAGDVGFGLVAALDHSSSRPSLLMIFVFVYDNFGLFIFATMSVSRTNFSLEED
jgi:hypothetical protein